MFKAGFNLSFENLSLGFNAKHNDALLVLLWCAFNRNREGYSYFAARGEILGFAEDERLRKHLPNMFSLIKNES